ncbi:reverse transcriptase domain-containing protein [Tanacetum coccineum]
MANVTPIIATIKNAGVKEKTLKEADAVPKANILNFCEEHYEDILPIIMDRTRHDKRKEVQTRLDFGESSRKIQRERENSLNSRAGNSPIRFHYEISRTRGRERYDDRNVFNRLSHRKKSVHERLNDTYSPSITKSGPSTRDPSHSRGRSLSRNRPRIRDRLHGVEKSYDDAYSSYGTKTKYRDRSHGKDHSRSVKRWRESESPPSRGSESNTSNRRHGKSKAKRHKPADEEDLAVPWTCKDVDPFTPRIRNFKSSRKTRMPNNVKTYDGTGDPEDHLKIFQAAAQVERWAMPTWCHMGNSTLIGAARVWFDELPPESIDGYKAAFLAYFMQQKKYVKVPAEIHNIKQRDGETIEEFIECFKIETGRIKGAPKCMRIFIFMHGVNNPELTKRLNEHVPKTVEEMMTATTAFIRGETAAASKKKVHTPWKSQDQSKRHTSERRSDFQNQPKDGRGSNKFTPLTITPKEIFMAESEKFKPPSPMVTPVEKRSNNKFCEFYNDKRHNTDECVQLRKQIKELKVTESFARVNEITFPPLTANKGTEGPLVIEAKIGGHAVHHMYVDRGYSMEVLYEHCFNRLQPEIKNQMVPATTSLTDFSGETIWLLGQLRLLVTIGDAEYSTKAWMNFMIVRSLSPYNGISGRHGIREIQAVPSTAHRMLKFPVNGGIVTIRSTILMPTECATIAATPKDSAKKAEARYENFKLAIHTNFPD